ncbi:MAG: hypothetical protein RLZZ380_472 [Actinomycetota bacterium]
MVKQVTAILVVHDESVLAQRALASIKSQTVSPDRIVVVDTSQNPIELGTHSIKLSSKSKLGEIVSAATAGLTPSEEHWFWLVHDDSEPKTNSLAELLDAVSVSETIAQVGSMQLSAENPRAITQLGLTLSPFGEPINPINRQLDQSQHDHVVDSFAVSTSSMMVRSDVYELVGGFDNRSPALATDFDLSIRIRRHGFRVVVAPRAKVVHARLSLSGKRQNGWLGGSTKTAMRRAAINLHLVHDPLPLALLYWLVLPGITLYRVFWRLAQKRPGHIWSELRAGFWGSFTLPKRLLSRANSGKASFRSLKSLRASWSTVSTHKRADLEAEESANSLAAFERGDHEAPLEERSKSFAQAGGWILAILLLALSWKLFPLSPALTGGSAIPLSGNWFELFARAGASWQPIGQGFFGPSDPFNWVLLTLGSLTFWSPSLSLVILVWAGKALAFITAWKALSLLTAKAWQRNLGALVYALLPAFASALGAGEYPAIVATITVPWLVYSVARAAGIGRRGSARSDARTWSWIGLSGVLLAIIGAAAPVVAILSLVGLALVAFTKIRRFGYLFWIPLPLAAIYLPLSVYQIFVVGQPLALLAEPTLGITVNSSAVTSLFDLQNWTHWSLALLIAFSVGALLVQRWVVALVIALFGALSYLLLTVTQALSFPADLLSARAGFTQVFTTGHSLAAFIGLVAVALSIHLLAALNRKAAIRISAGLMVLATMPLGFAAATLSPKVSGTDGTVVPLLLEKQAEQGTDLQLLVINKKDDEYRVELSSLAGNTLEDSNLAYRFSAELNAKSKNYLALSQVVGDLVSGNGAADGSVLKQNQIGYLLVPNNPANADLVAALESSSLLEGAGMTPYGDLWRVLGTSAEETPASSHSPWSITKAAQLMALLGFVLLAVPSRPKVRKAKDTAIFIDQSESELDV